MDLIAKDRLARLVFFLILPCLFACSSKPLTHQIELRQDSFVSLSGDSPVYMRKGETVESPQSEPLLIEAPNYAAVLIPPITDSSSKFKVTLKPLDHWGDDLVQYRTELMLNELFLGLAEVQQSFTDKKFDVALAKSTEMEKKMPRVGYLKFLKARCLMLTGDYNQAKQLLEKAVAQFPENKDGRELYDQAVKGAPPERLPAETEAQAKP